MKKTGKYMVWVLCAALACGGMGRTFSVLAAEEEKVSVNEEKETDTPEASETEKKETAASEVSETEEKGTAASEASETEKKETAASEASETEKKGTDTSAAHTGFSKDETVYVMTGSNGTVQNIIVSDWIQNPGKAGKIEDRSDLTGVENVKGDEQYTQGSGDTLVWDAQGSDIYYQGDIDRQPPVEISVAYRLDGKEITPEELAGKSGRVTIRYTYTNNQYEYAEVNNARTKIYVPFTVLTGMILDNEVFSNVEVSNGRLINDGDRTIVAGLAFPGMQENLGIGEEKLEIPDYVEITADAEDFELGMTASIVTNAVFNGAETEKEDSLDDLNGLLGELTDAMDQLTDGSDQLYDGICTLLEKSDELIQGIDKLASGASELRTGAGALNEGALKLQSGAASLQAGLNTLSANNGELNGGARQVFETLLSTAQAQLNAAGLSVPAMSVENYADVLNGVIASLDETAVYQQAQAQVTAAVESQRAYIESQVAAAVQAQVEPQVTAAVREQVEAQVAAIVRENVEAQVIQNVLTANGMSSMNREEYEAAVAAGTVPEDVQTAVNSTVEAQMGSDDVRNTITAQTDNKMASDDIKAMIAQNTAAKLQSDEIRQIITSNTELKVQEAISANMAGEEVQAKLAAASEGARSVISLKTSLDSYNTFYIGLQTYTAGVAQAAAGAGELKGGTDELKNGTEKLYSGTSELYSGIQTMKKGAPALTDGIKQLRDGAKELSDGLDTFNEEAIQKLVEAVDGDLDSLVERFRAASDASKRYQSFAGIGDDMEGKVKFVYRTEAIEAGE